MLGVGCLGLCKLLTDAGSRLITSCVFVQASIPFSLYLGQSLLVKSPSMCQVFQTWFDSSKQTEGKAVASSAVIHPESWCCRCRQQQWLGVDVVIEAVTTPRKLH